MKVHEIIFGVIGAAYVAYMLVGMAVLGTAIFH